MLPACPYFISKTILQILAGFNSEIDSGSWRIVDLGTGYSVTSDATLPIIATALLDFVRYITGQAGYYVFLLSNFMKRKSRKNRAKKIGLVNI